MSRTNKYRLGIQISIVAVFTVLATMASTVPAFAQGNAGRAKNNPYFPSPSTRVNKDEPPRAPVVPSTLISNSTVARHDTEIVIRPAVPVRAESAAKDVETRSSSPMETYKIGVGDIVYVNLKNAPNSSGYYTVKANGMIDFPLAGDRIEIIGRTAVEAAGMLAAGITLYRDPQVEVKVRDYRSHKINISGMVDQAGETSIQREAVPLYVICAQAGVDPKATKALVRRNDYTKVETFDLHDANSDKVLIYPGNSIEFTVDANAAMSVTTGFYYIAGSVNSTGQRPFAAGMTLSQAIAASGGAKGNPKKAVIRRKSDKGALNLSEYDLRAIKDRKNTDPVLAPGDMIEIAN